MIRYRVNFSGRYNQTHLACRPFEFYETERLSYRHVDMNSLLWIKPGKNEFIDSEFWQASEGDE